MASALFENMPGMLDKAQLRALLPFPAKNEYPSFKTMLTKDGAKELWQRGLLLWVAISMAAAWAIASTFGPPGHVYKGLSPLGTGIPTHPKYGLDPTKLAIVIEPRPEGFLASHLLHTAGTLPLAWPVLYIGSNESMSRIEKSHGITMMKERGKLTLQVAPDWMDLQDPGNITALLGSEDFYDALPASVEWLFVSGTDSVLCSNSLMTMNDWLSYDYIGSPWAFPSWVAGGNNGFSLRRISAVRRTLRSMRRVTFDIDDMALAAAIQKVAKVLPTEDDSANFVMERKYMDRAMAYHPPVDEERLIAAPWNKTELRKAIFSHCPELKTVMDMKTFWERCPEGEHNGTSLGRPW